jgi:hypothetical protein
MNTVMSLFISFILSVGNEQNHKIHAIELQAEFKNVFKRFWTKKYPLLEGDGYLTMWWEKLESVSIR